MRSSPLSACRLALPFLAVLLSLANGANAFKNYSANALTFSTFSGFADHGWFQCDTDNNYYIIHSTTTLGATVSANFRGTAVYLLALVDVDRATLDISVDNGTATSVAGSFPNRQCRIIFSNPNLAYGDHSISVTVKTADASGDTKFEIASFIYTAPEPADLATLAPSSTAPLSSTNSGTGGIPKASNTNNANNLAAASVPLDGGGIAGIVIGCLAIIAIAAAILLFYFHRQRSQAGLARSGSSAYPASPAMSHAAPPASVRSGGGLGLAIPGGYAANHPQSDVVLGSPTGISPNRLGGTGGMAGTGAFQGQPYNPPSQQMYAGEPIQPTARYPDAYSGGRL